MSEKMKKIVDEIMEVYPAKVMKGRKSHMLIKDSSQKQEIAANTRAIPGIITNRGCAYAGCKGVVIGPIVDMVHIVHGPVGCSYYAWGTRRNKGKAREDGQNFLEYAFTTDLQESDIVANFPCFSYSTIKRHQQLQNFDGVESSVNFPEMPIPLLLF
jgi:nitrogenase molybdenum-iron protein alpha chain